MNVLTSSLPCAKTQSTLYNFHFYYCFSTNIHMLKWACEPCLVMCEKWAVYTYFYTTLSPLRHLFPTPFTRVNSSIVYSTDVVVYVPSLSWWNLTRVHLGKLRRRRRSCVWLSVRCIPTLLWEQNVAWGLKVKWVSCFQYSESRSRSGDVKIAHVGAYRSYAHMGPAACLENLRSKPSLLRMALLDFTPSP